MFNHYLKDGVSFICVWYCEFFDSAQTLLSIFTENYNGIHYIRSVVDNFFKVSNTIFLLLKYMLVSHFKNGSHIK